jgi:hypothetical protein
MVPTLIASTGAPSWSVSITTGAPAARSTAAARAAVRGAQHADVAGPGPDLTADRGSPLDHRQVPLPDRSAGQHDRLGPHLRNRRHGDPTFDLALDVREPVPVDQPPGEREDLRGMAQVSVGPSAVGPSRHRRRGRR